MPNRIRELRTKANLSQDELAAAAGTTKAQISKLENGERRLTEDWMERLAEPLGVDRADLMISRGMPEKPEPRRVTRRASEDTTGNMMVIDELDVKAGQSIGGQVHPSDNLQYSHENVIARWQVPAVVIRGHTAAPASAIKIITAIGDSNKPEILSGERLMIDTTDRIPVQGGFFAIWNGVGETIKKLSVVLNSDPPMVRVVSASPDKETYPTEIVELADLIVNGRVVGRWDRL